MGRPLALITGASSGIGRALALRFARGGFDLALSGRDGAALDSAAAECAALGAAASTHVADLSRPGAAAELARALGRVPDVLVNNAGFTVHGAFAGTDIRRERDMLEVHLGAALELIKAVLPGMLRRGSGRVLNVGSVYSYIPVPEQAVYGASKAFLGYLSHALRGELEGTGVTVSLICPGITESSLRERAGVKSKGIPGTQMRAEAVADAAYEGTLRGDALIVPGWGNKLMLLGARLLGSHRLPGIVRAVNRLRGLRPPA